MKGVYDVIIIGAGIGGLVCGCYLAKAGMKVLIVEQHSKPGGYCTSFKRKGFTFDAAADCFGAYRENGTMRRILQELGVDREIKIIQHNPPNAVYTPEYRVFFWPDINKTIQEFQQNFPEERENIKRFFRFVVDPNPATFVKLRNYTFKDILDSYLTNPKLKTILAYPLLAIGGLPENLMSAFVGVKLYSEFLIDGGYYPMGGMQALADMLAKRFKDFGGKIIYSMAVKRVKIINREVKGVLLSNREFVPSRYVVSNCDARQTFLRLIGKEKVEKTFYQKIKSMIPSISNYIVYLGMDKDFKPKINPGTAIFYINHYDLQKAYSSIQKGDIDIYDGYSLRVSSDKSTVNVIIPMPYKNKKYWKHNKYRLLEKVIKKIEETLLPGLSNYIVYKEAATPHTLFRYTLNFRGASYGWASIPEQFADPDLLKPNFIKGLFLVGHWTTFGVGISGVSYVGQYISTMLLKKPIK